MAQVIPVEPESEKFALSPTADLDEIREFLRCESIERTQLCMRLQKQQELLEQLIDVPLKRQELHFKQDEQFISSAWQKELVIEVDHLKCSVENLSQEVKDLQESVEPERRLKPATHSMVLKERKDDDGEEQAVHELDRSWKVQSDTSEFGYEGELPWLDERLEVLQKQQLGELGALEERLAEEFANLKGFVDAAIVAMVSRLSGLEIFVKGEGGLFEKLDGLKQAADDVPRLKALEKQISEMNERLGSLEKRVPGEHHMVAFSPAFKGRPLKHRGIETNDSAIEKVESFSPKPVLSHGPAPVQAAPPGSLKVPSWGAPVFAGASSSQLVTVLATPRPMEAPSAGCQGRSVTPSRGYVRAPVMVRY